MNRPGRHGYLDARCTLPGKLLWITAIRLGSMEINYSGDFYGQNEVADLVAFHRYLDKGCPLERRPFGFILETAGKNKKYSNEKNKRYSIHCS